LAVLHDEANWLQLAYVGKRMSSHGHEIREFAGLRHADAVLPTQHFRSICRVGTNDVKRRHSDSVQGSEQGRAGSPTRLSVGLVP